MSYRANLQKNNTSGIQGLRLRHRYTRTNLLRFFIDVTWSDDGRRRCSSIPCRPESHLKDTKRALELRAERTQSRVTMSARRAFDLLSAPYLGKRS